MHTLLDISLRAALLCAYVVVPGWAALRLLGFRSASRSDVLLACFALGSAYTSQAVTLLLQLHIYTRVTAVAVLAAPIVAVALKGGRHSTIDRSLPSVAHARDGIDRAVLAAAAVFLLVYLVDAASTPMTWWDGLATWGKWAADWGRRTDSAGYLVGGYPQLVPRVISVLYKLTGSHSDILPIDFFAAHVFHVVFAAWFVLAAVRVTELLDLPAWPAVLAGLGSSLFREHTGAGTVDVLLAAQVMTLLALYLGWTRDTWRASVHPAWVLGASAYATLNTKLTGVIGPLILVSLHTSVRRRFASADWATLRRALAIGFVLFLPFIVEQGYTELNSSSFFLKPSEVNFSVRETPTIVATDAELTYRGGGFASRLHLGQLRFWNSYDVPATLRVLFTMLLLGAMLLSVRSWFARAVLPVLVVSMLTWALWSSYDQRNIFAILPVIAIVGTYGAQAAWRLKPSILSQTVVALWAGLFLVLAGGSLLRELQARAEDMTSGSRRIQARIDAIRRGPDARIELFYPQYAADYHAVRELAERTHAEHVIVTSPMYRFFSNGAHPLGVWPYDRTRPGDLFVAHEGRPPASMSGWTFVRKLERHRVWVFAPSPQREMSK